MLAEIVLIFFLIINTIIGYKWGSIAERNRVKRKILLKDRVFKMEPGFSKDGKLKEMSIISDIVSCEKCKCLIYKKDAIKGEGEIMPCCPWEKEEEYIYHPHYCLKCALAKLEETKLEDTILYKELMEILCVNRQQIQEIKQQNECKEDAIDEARKDAFNDKIGITIDTVKAFDTGIWETAINRNRNGWTIVERYPSREIAKRGHKNWVRKMKENPKCKLTDIGLYP